MTDDSVKRANCMCNCVQIAYITDDSVKCSNC